MCGIYKNVPNVLIPQRDSLKSFVPSVPVACVNCFGCFGLFWFFWFFFGDFAIFASDRRLRRAKENFLGALSNVSPSLPSLSLSGSRAGDAGAGRTGDFVGVGTDTSCPSCLSCLCLVSILWIVSISASESLARSNSTWWGTSLKSFRSQSLSHKNDRKIFDVQNPWKSLKIRERGPCYLVELPRSVWNMWSLWSGSLWSLASVRGHPHAKSEPLHARARHAQN